MEVISRQAYLNGEVSHEQYYGQFVIESTIDLVSRSITVKLITESNDPHFNDIPLYRWDLLSATIFAGRYFNSKKFTAAGDLYSPSSGVCIAKEAARQIKEKELNKT